MRLHSLSAVCLFFVFLPLVFLTGCGGPTKAGLEARADARARSSLVSAQISYDQAKRAFEVGQFDRAMSEITSAIERSPDQPAFHILQGRIALEQHRLEAAIASLEQAIEMAQEQLALLQSVERRAGDGPRDLTRARVGEGGERGESRLTAQLAAAHYFAGIVYQRWSNHHKAFDSYAMAAEFDPENAQYLVAAAEALIAMGDYEQARQLVQPQLAYFEHNAALRHLLGQIAMLQSDFELAVRLLRESRMLNPDDLLLLEELARAQFAAGLYAECYDSLNQLRDQSSHQSSARRGESPLGTNSSPRRVASGDQTSTANGRPSMELTHRPDLLQLEARVLTKLDRLVEARSLYMQLTELEPSKSRHWIELGSIAYAIGDQRRLSQSASRLLTTAEHRWEGHFLQGMYERVEARRARDAAQRAAHVERSIRHLHAAADRVSVDGASSSDARLVHLMLGRMLEREGDNDGAMAAYAEVLRLVPDDPIAQRRYQVLRGSEALTAVPIE